MIHYQLRCAADHAFDGWFRDSAAFDRQAETGLIACPDCSDTRVRRALMAPALGRGRQAKPMPSVAVVPPPPDPPPDRPPGDAAPDGLPDRMRAVLQKLRAEVETRCDNVGDRFADEARRMHSGETKARGIYGDATREEAEALAEDGIAVSRIPWVPRAES